MSWLPEVEEIERRKQFAYKLGGKDGVDRQHNQGKLTIRERVEGLVDPGSWREIGALTGSATYGKDGQLEDVKPSNAVIGTGVSTDAKSRSTVMTTRPGWLVRGNGLGKVDLCRSVGPRNEYPADPFGRKRRR